MIGKTAGTRDIHDFCSSPYVHGFFHVLRVNCPEDKDVYDNGKDKYQCNDEDHGGDL